MEPDKGWFTDPYGLHEARWMEGGRPTKLVADGGVKTFDDIPSEAPTKWSVPLPGPGDEEPISDRTWRLGLRWVLIVCVAVGTALFARHATTSHVAAPPTAPPQGRGLRYAGTLVEEVPSPGQGTLSLAYSVASPTVLGADHLPTWAEQALGACGDSPSNGDIAVVARVRVTLHGSWVSSASSNGFVAVDALGVGDINEPAATLGAPTLPLGLKEATFDSHWVCGETGSQLNARQVPSMPPPPLGRTSFNLPMVVLAEHVLTGRSSQFDKGVNSDWAFTGATGGGQVDAATGPHAFACGSAPPEISLFATPPFDVPTSQGTDQIPCRAPNS